MTLPVRALGDLMAAGGTLLDHMAMHGHEGYPLSCTDMNLFIALQMAERAIQEAR